MMTLTNVPLSVYNRALDLYGLERAADPKSARAALDYAEGSINIVADFPGITPFAQAIAEYMSLSGPWSEQDGEHAGESGYQVRSAETAHA